MKVKREKAGEVDKEWENHNWELRARQRSTQEFFGLVLALM
jgi:hypothetical protein